VSNKEYISSGVLESYVLGSATEQERLEVERIARLYPEVQEEIVAIQDALNEYALTHQQQPPAALKQKIWSKLQDIDVAPVRSEVKQGAKIVSINSAPSFNFQRLLAAASVTLLIGSTALNVMLYSELKNTEESLTALNAEKEFFAQQFKVQSTSLQQTQEEMAFLTQPSTRVINLKGVPKFSDALATAYWNTSTHDLYLKINNLPAPPSEMQYQLWAIVDGKPVDAGVFDLADNNVILQKMKSFNSAQAFAVTLEKKGGSVAPNLDAMYVIGNV